MHNSLLAAGYTVRKWAHLDLLRARLVAFVGGAGSAGHGHGGAGGPGAGAGGALTINIGHGGRVVAGSRPVVQIASKV